MDRRLGLESRRSGIFEELVKIGGPVGVRVVGITLRVGFRL